MPADGPPAQRPARESDIGILRHLYRATPDVGMVALDLHGRILEWNAGAEELYGHPFEDMYLRPLATLYPNDADGTRAAAHLLDEAVRSGRAEGEGWRLRKDGGRFWGRDTLTFLRDEEGRALGLGLVVLDLTRHREVREVLQISARKFRTSQPGPPDGHAMLGCVRDETGTIVDFEFLYADPAGKRAFGAEGESISGRQLRKLEPRALTEDLFPRYAQVVETGDTLEEELHFEHQDGEDWFRVTATRIGDGIALTLANLTRVRRADKSLQDQETRYLQAQKMESLGRLAGGVAHDFNNMLTAIMINSHLLLEHLPEGDPRRIYSEEIDGIAAHAASLTQQILAYGGKKPPEPRVLDLNRVISAVATMLRRLIGDNIKLRTDLDPALQPMRADPVHVQQLLLNLVINARDAMPGGGRITIETRHLPEQEEEAEAEAVPRTIMLSVSDTGIGMDESTRKRIFEPFFTTKQAGEGTGLGLATVDTIVRKSGGVIYVDSEWGRGSTFRIHLPSVTGRISEAGGETEKLEERRGTETILLVEDDQKLRFAVRGFLLRKGYHVIEAKSGKGALWRAVEHKGSIDLLVSDVKMPGMTGPRLAEELRVRRPGMRVLFISGYGKDEVVGIGPGPGADAPILSKPFSPIVLLRTIRQTLDAAREGEIQPSTAASRFAPPPEDRPPQGQAFPSEE